jgi:transcription elongation factor GreB
MSRVCKEDDQEETPIVPPRALTGRCSKLCDSRWYGRTFERKQELISEKRIWKLPMKMKALALNHINAKLQLLNNRIAC